MAIHMWCIVAAWIIVYLTKVPVAFAMQRAGGYDNRNPRDQQSRLEGFGARSLAAHMNGFETFAPFAAAVLVASLAGAEPGPVDTLAVVFVVARLAYVVCYLADQPTLRSTVWTVGSLATLGLFLSPVLWPV
jgi:uncharacterized MAPEG superfamily protein